jgi:hypothetical protein
MLPRYTLVHSGTRTQRQFTEKNRAARVGIWDLGAWVGALPHVIEALNASQQAFTFFEIQAAIPAGLRSSARRLKSFSERRLRRALTRAEKHDAVEAVLDEDFFPRGEAVRRDLQIDYLVGFSPAPLAGITTPPGQRRRTIYFDLLSSTDEAYSERTSIVSGYGLRPLAAEANRPYEMAVAFLSVRTLLIDANRKPALEFHKDTGCVFDFTDDRTLLVPLLLTPRVEASCQRKIDAKHRSAALQMFQALDQYRVPSAT